jgi:hypothetical protein
LGQIEDPYGLGLAWPESLSHNVARKRTKGRSETALVPVPERCTNTHPILRVSFGLCDRRITLRDLSTIRTVTRPVIWREQANALIDGLRADGRLHVSNEVVITG